MNVVFVNYGLFNSNSGGHVAHFANALSDLGANVTVLGTNDPETVNDFGPPCFEAIRMPEVGEEIPAEILALAGRPDTVIHAWTPRRRVYELVDAMVQETGCPYIVHLEDHEHLLLDSVMEWSWDSLAKLGVDELDGLIPHHLSHPVRSPRFIRNSAGATLIVEKLGELCPDDLPKHVLEPGVDTDQFNADLTAAQIAAIREELFIDDGAKIIVYNGNMHSANHHEVFSLYTAVMILRRRGHNIVLVRTGKDHYDKVDVSYSYLRGDWTIDLGVVDRDRMIETLKIADVFVQPGASEGFNAYRLPSKLPEFLALGRPLLLPATNIGLRLRDGVEAILLKRGDAEEIADRVAEVIFSEDAGRSIGEAGRQFATENLNWRANASHLLNFYRSRLDGSSATLGTPKYLRTK